MRRFRIAQRLVLCFSVTALLLVALGVFCLLQMQSIRDQGEAVESGSLPSIAMADAIAIDLIKLRGESARLIANADDPGAVVTSKINIEQLKNEVEKASAITWPMPRTAPNATPSKHCKKLTLRSYRGCMMKQP